MADGVEAPLEVGFGLDTEHRQPRDNARLWQFVLSPLMTEAVELEHE